MDSNDLNNNEPNQGSAPAGQPSVDGFIPPRVSMGDNIDTTTPVNSDPSSTITQQLNDNSNTKSSKGSKCQKALLIVFVILFALAAAGAGYMYMQYQSVQSDLDTTQSTLDAAEATSQAQIQSLTTSLEVQTEYATQLSATVDELKTLCGADCDSVEVPEPPVTSEITE